MTGTHHLTFHQSVLGECLPLVGIYVGCALQLFGDAVSLLVKVHLESPTPTLVERIKVDLAGLRVDYFEHVATDERQRLEGYVGAYYYYVPDPGKPQATIEEPAVTTTYCTLPAHRIIPPRPLFAGAARMADEPPFVDLTTLFIALQQELEAAGIGKATSLEAQLRSVESDLVCHFENPTHLSACLGTGGLTYEHAFLKRTHPRSAPILLILLQEYRTAADIDSRRLFLTLADSHEKTGRAYEHLVSTATLEGMFTESNARVLVKSQFANIGDVIESSLLPFLKIRLNVLRIATGTASDHPNVDDLSLGQTIDELEQTDAGTYSPAPFGIRLSQWRNIAFHGNYQVRGHNIHCWYGKRPERFACTPAQLQDVAKYVNDVYYVHKVAHEVFGIDNAERLLQVSRASGQRPEARIFDPDFNTDTILAYSIVACGFRIQNAGRTGVRWMLVLEDRHGRMKDDAERTLKEALASYLIHVNSLHLQALIRSAGTTYHVSFRGALTQSAAKLLPGQHTPYTIAQNFRVNDSLGH